MAVTLVTGGTGFVGANLARALLDAGHAVHLLVREGYTAWRIQSIEADIQLHIAELADEDQVQKVVQSVKPDWIYHLAAHGAYSWQRDEAAIMQTNLVGTMNLIRAALVANVSVFVNTGSSSEYGYQDHAPTEDEMVDPNSVYAVMKAASTMYCRYIAQQHNIYIPTLRLYSVYGAYEEPKRLMPSLILHGLQGQYPPLVNPDTARDFIYVDDVSQIYLQVIEQKGDEKAPIYNIGGGQQVTLKEAVDTVRDILQLEAEPTWGTMEQRQWDTNVWFSNIDKIQREHHWRPETTLRDGLAQTIEWFSNRPAMIDYYGGSLFGG